MKDFILHLLEKYGGKISCWAWNKRFAKRDSNEWIKGYRKWKIMTNFPYDITMIGMFIFITLYLIMKVIGWIH